MKKAIILFNGIQYSHDVVEQGFTWVRLNTGVLIAIFLRAKKEPSEGYIFPSDLDAAENLNTTEEAEANYVAIINSNIKMLQHEAASEHIEIRCLSLLDPPIGELFNQSEGCELIFTSENTFETGILTADSINWKKFIKDLSIPVEIIPNNE